MESQHVQLPLWADRSPTQKFETLKQLIDDLYVYCLQDARQKLQMLLDEHEPFDGKEVEDVKAIKEMVDKYPNILNKNCEIGHVVGSALVLDLTTGRFLLHHHKSLGLFLQFGGHAEYETNLAEVALREAREESGLPDLFFYPTRTDPRPLDIDKHTIPSSKNRPDHYHLDLRYLLATNKPNELSPGAEESNSFIWLTYSDIMARENQFYPPLIRLIGKAYRLYTEDSG